MPEQGSRSIRGQTRKERPSRSGGFPTGLAPSDARAVVSLPRARGAPRGALLLQCQIGPLVAERIDAIDRIYWSGPLEDAVYLLHTHQVDYVFVGSLERDKYGYEVLRRFSFLPVAFQAPGAIIYNVPPPN